MKYAFINGIILDGTEQMEPRRGYAVLTNGDKIDKIVPQSSRFPGYVTVDLEGKYLMPGLINLHVHLPGSGKPKKKEADTRKLVKLVSANKATRYAGRLICRSFAKTELMSGVTTVRTVGGVLNLDSVVREEVASGKVVGPRILASNMAVSVPGVRTIIKVDRQKAVQLFTDYISENSLTAEQEEYLKSILDYVCENGDMETAALVNESPFDEINVLELFPGKFKQVADFVANLHKSITAA